VPQSLVLARRGDALIAEFTEVETGQGADALDRRPQLAAALAAGKTGMAKAEHPSWQRQPDAGAIPSTRPRH
jgi:hypothetical protein